MTSVESVQALNASDNHLLEVAESALYAELNKLDWDLEATDTDDFTHAMHSYPAKFIPQIPARLISTLSRPDELIVDPFSGGGTTGVEAMRAGRRFVGIDANPIAVLLGRIKTTPLSARGKLELRVLLQEIRNGLIHEAQPAILLVPDIPNIAKWYSEEILAALSRMRLRTDTVSDDAAKNVARMAFANTAARVSFQESESRYVSKPRPIDQIEAWSVFGAELDRMYALANRLDGYADAPSCSFRLGDARMPDDMLGEVESAGLVVTSPPYPNAYDYHLYHRFRLFWLGESPLELRRVEIGSHLKHQSEQNPAASYEVDMSRVLENIYNLLRPGRYCAMVLGNGVYRGDVYETAKNISKIAALQGWSVLPLIERRLPPHRRSITAAGRRLQTENILLLRRPSYGNAGYQLSAISPNYQRHPYELDLAHKELDQVASIAISHRANANATGAGERGLTERARGLAFSHAVRLETELPIEFSTLQRSLEAPLGGKRKNSTYVTHGIHRYKGKFYPQLAKALLNLSELNEHRGIVLDPFGGSGTVLLESVINGRDAVSVDCNPLAVAIARAKVEILDVDGVRLAESSDALLKTVDKQSDDRSVRWEQFESRTHAELMSWFPTQVLSKISLILDHIRRSDDPRLVGFYQVILSDIVREVSQQEPRDLRIRRRREPIDDAPVVDLFEQRLRTALAKIASYQAIAANLRPLRGTGTAVLGNSADDDCYRSWDVDETVFDCVISSPPYASALPYIDTDRLSLAVIYGFDGKRRRELESRLIGSREITKTDTRKCEAVIISGDSKWLPPSTSAFLGELLDAVSRDSSAGFRKRQLPTVLLRYFTGISRVLHQVERRVATGTHLWFVLGDNRTNIGGSTRSIPTVREFTAIAERAGLELLEQIPITVTRENVAHAKHSITANTIVHLRSRGAQ